MAVTQLFSSAVTEFDLLVAALDEIESAWGGLTPRRGCTTLAEDVRDADDAAVVDLVHSLGGLRWQVDALLAVAAQAVDQRSAPERGRAGLARRAGNRNSADLLAEVTGVAPAEAKTFVRVGWDIVGERSCTGEVLPARSPCVADALMAGELGVAHENEIVRFRARVQARVASEILAAAEAQLVQLAVVERLRLRELQCAIA